ncbi:MAG: hypothetical protein H6Q42_2467, partial [Deltaproteobacteria bacterium]|nr:hypothetical protein [Deltaproteobacteria bacterium]
IAQIVLTYRRSMVQIHYRLPIIARGYAASVAPFLFDCDKFVTEIFVFSIISII